jgi:hypothetical protein
MAGATSTVVSRRLEGEQGIVDGLSGIGRSGRAAKAGGLNPVALYFGLAQGAALGK